MSVVNKMGNKTKSLFGSRFKLIYAVVQMVLFYISIGLFPNFDLLIIFAVVLSYLVPLYINSYMIKFKDSKKKLSSYIFEDFIYYYLPSVALSLIIEMLMYFMGIIGDMVGFFTVVLFIVFTLLTVFQWLRYSVQIKMTRKNNVEDLNQ